MFSCSFSLLYLRQWHWTGERRVCHCHCPGQSSSQGRFSYSWRPTDRCESLLAPPLKIHLIIFFFLYSLSPHLPYCSSHRFPWLSNPGPVLFQYPHSKSQIRWDLVECVKQREESLLLWLNPQKTCSSRGLGGAVFAHEKTSVRNETIHHHLPSFEKWPCLLC